jgi:hypothetical protein
LQVALIMEDTAQSIVSQVFQPNLSKQSPYIFVELV